MSGIGKYEFNYGLEVKTANPPWYGVLAVLIMTADTRNLVKLMSAFPDEVSTVQRMWLGESNPDVTIPSGISGAGIEPNGSGNGGG